MVERILWDRKNKENRSVKWEEKVDIIKQSSISQPKKPFSYVYWVQRALILFSTVTLFLPAFFPARITDKISKYCSIFTAAVSYSNLTANVGLGFRYISALTFRLVQFSGIALVVGVAVSGIGGCMSLGNNKMRLRGSIFPMIGSAFLLLGDILARNAFGRFDLELKAAGKKLGQLEPGWNLNFFLVFAVTLLVISALLFVSELRNGREERMEMQERYKLFLYILPILMLAFIFSYLPLWGWRYAFFDYKSGADLTADNFVGFKWFGYLFSSEVTRTDIMRVLKNTLVMSSLGILTSWFPVAFAIFLSEIRSTGFRKSVQILTTIPNFISWVLVYAIAFAFFSTEGFVNDLIEALTKSVADTNYLQNDTLSWIKMLAWGTWKGLGWSAIIYIAAISGVDQSLYEAAMVDGAGRFKRMWHITVPALIPTYCVMLMLSIANILSNGMEQYLVFSNPINKNTLEVLDLYVYTLGIVNSNGGAMIPLSTVVSMAKSLISVFLLFVANNVSKAIRGENII